MKNDRLLILCIMSLLMLSFNVLSFMWSWGWGWIASLHECAGLVVSGLSGYWHIGIYYLVPVEGLSLSFRLVWALSICGCVIELSGGGWGWWAVWGVLVVYLRLAGRLYVLRSLGMSITGLNGLCALSSWVFCSLGWVVGICAVYCTLVEGFVGCGGCCGCSGWDGAVTLYIIVVIVRVR